MFAFEKSLRVKRSIVNAGLTVIAAGCSLLLGEIAARALYPFLADYNLEMWRYGAELKERLPDPRLPFHHYPNRGGTYYGVEIKTNSFGFRDREYSLTKPPGVYRIVTLGDSMTMGWGVPLDKTYAKVLEQRWNDAGRRIEVINLGIGNYNSVMETALFQKKGLPLQPDMVIVGYYVNDAEPTPVFSRWGRAIRAHTYLGAVIFDIHARIRAFLDPRFDCGAYYQALYRNGAPALESNRKALETLIDLCREKGISLLLVNIPDIRDLANPELQVGGRFLREVAATANAPFLDLWDALQGHPPSDLWVSPSDPHLNALGHALAAAAIFEKTERILSDR
ncbi:MAG TPA: SGNH/GDSL hydrolase family protein [Candidatus Hydrogenedentes bacterium]|nr:SGNH/GDSL hydrolase family protein [Candidatus Hydrogenedentota bacterium]HOS02258.1 SGNH/GDSL hydrolase family protein [Candidatus Hydrogenedentota bacterium]